MKKLLLSDSKIAPKGQGRKNLEKMKNERKIGTVQSRKNTCFGELSIYFYLKTSEEKNNILTLQQIFVVGNIMHFFMTRLQTTFSLFDQIFDWYCSSFPFPEKLKDPRKY